MSIYPDLHCHSTASDGELTPAQLVEKAVTVGITHLALTDHDTTNGLSEAREAASIVDIELINGIELSCRWGKQTLHVVGLNIDDSHNSIGSATRLLADLREQRAIKIGEKLAKAGIPDAYVNAKRIVGAGTLTRQHFSQYLVEAGYAKDQSDVFKRYLVRNKPGFVSVEWPSLEETINCIHQAGGVAVIAHPLRYKMTASKLRKLIMEFKSLGGDAIEVVTGQNNPNEVSQAASYARQYGLAASRGSDFHNNSTPWGQLGKLSGMPANLQPVWELWQ